ncbi:MAG: mannitol dehydrogenase family protein [Bacteriovorax sp.]|nr:mannitol dehydrogenase family protein [Rhizobacter sp.]
MTRLHPSQLAGLAPDVTQPRYERTALHPGIVHLGTGAFHRGQLAVVNEAAIIASGDLRWGTVGVSLQTSDIRDALASQAGLYSVALRDTAEDGSPRETLQVVGNLLDVLFAPDDPMAVIERIAHPDTRIVSLTIADEGDPHDPAADTSVSPDTDIAHDLSNPTAPRTAIGFIVHALNLRRSRDLAPVTLLACDDLPANGDTLRALVLAFAEQVDTDLRDWIEARCTFPNSMVDRIVLRISDDDRQRISTRLGLEDAAPVMAESYQEWVVEDRFANGRPVWSQGGARFVEHAQPFETLKLRMVNGSHSALAYLGAMAGLRTVDCVLAVPTFHRYLSGLMREEIAPTLPPLLDLDLDDYRSRLLDRLANPALQHQTHLIAANGSQKVPQRLLDTVRDRLSAHQPFDRLALAVAAWIHYLGGVDETGLPHVIHDPLAGPLAERLVLTTAATSVHDRIQAFIDFKPVFGDLGQHPRFVTEVARHALSLQAFGVINTLESLP